MLLVFSSQKSIIKVADMVFIKKLSLEIIAARVLHYLLPQQYRTNLSEGALYSYFYACYFKKGHPATHPT